MMTRDDRAAIVRAVRAQVRVVAGSLDPKGIAQLYVDEIPVKVSHRPRPEWARGGSKRAGRSGCYSYEGPGAIGYITMNARVCHTPERFTKTLIHEFAHALDHWVNGDAAGGHGETWQAIMRQLGVAEPQRCHNYEGRL